MDASLNDLTERNSSASRGGRQCGAGQSSNFQPDRSPGRCGGPMRRDRTAARRSNGYNPYSKVAVNVSSTHDMYEGPDQEQEIDECPSITKIYKISISNLDYGVTSRNIQILLCDFWPLKIAHVVYDSAGQSMGRAEVGFYNKIDALKAVSLYNNVSLAGRRMKIKLVLDFPTISNLATRLRRPSPMPFRGNRGSGGEFGENRDYTRGYISENFGRRGAGEGSSIKQKISKKDELDAQLDGIMINNYKDYINLEKYETMDDIKLPYSQFLANKHSPLAVTACNCAQGYCQSLLISARNIPEGFQLMAAQQYPTYYKFCPSDVKQMTCCS